jgi:hypothetical protein
MQKLVEHSGSKDWDLLQTWWEIEVHDNTDKIRILCQSYAKSWGID